MEEKNLTQFSLQNLVFLPSFASFLLTHHLEAFISKQLHYSYALDIPLLKYFMQLPEDERIALSRQTTSELLSYLAKNEAAEQIKDAMQQWRANQLPIVNRDEVVAEDITLINYVRKKAMIDFVPAYTHHVDTIVGLVNEIDLFVIESITAGTNQYLQLFKERLNEHSHFIQKVAETVPGAVYVFDVQEYKGIYSNKKLAGVIGYEQEELNALGENVVPSLIHPDDQASLKEQSVLVKKAQEGEIIISKYRISKRDGSYKWLANYESVFKRKDNGDVWQTIGITLDIDNEQRTIEALHLREKELLEAQEITQLGNYYWDFDGKASRGSAKTFELLDISTKDFEGFIEKVHPDDREKISLETQKALASGKFNCEYRVVTTKGQKLIWARGIVDYKSGKPVGITGTVMDVTEHHQLTQRLALLDERHKQAEALTHIGTYAWNFLKDEVEWSDELYRIYEVAKEAPINFQFIVDAVVPEDKKTLTDTLQQCIATGNPFDFYYRIISGTGKRKILHSRGKIEKGDDGKPQRIVGTDQDVTEKQELIGRLRKSQSLYTQAEEMAAMGNWNWDVQANKLEWTDQLYRIYGLEPQSEEISIERFISFIHPDDRKAVEEGIEKINSEESLDYTFRIITPHGTHKWLRSLAQVLRDDDGRITYVIGTEQDVTEKQLLISKLEESQRLYKQAQKLAKLGNFTWNVQTGEVFWSDEVYRIYEKPFGQTVAFDDAFQPILDDHKILVSKAIEETLSSKKGRNVSYAIRKKDGGLRYVNLHTDVILNNADAVTHIIGTAQDVTEQHEAMETIREQEYFIQQIADASPTILYLFDVPSQSILYINREAFFVLGYMPDEIVEQENAVTDLLYHPEDFALLPLRRQSVKAFQQVDSMIQYECRMRHKGGGYRWLLVREIVFKTDDAGNINQVIGAALDITRRKEMEKTILQNAHQLEQSNASLEEFAYVASHDLKEPLRKISTFGDRLVASQIDKLSDDGKMYLRKIVDASQRMQNMISDLLSISMISGDQSFEPISLQKVLEDALQTLEVKIEQQKALIHHDALPEAQVIPSQFRQLFQNLISNSLKFVREGVQPEIWISCTVAATSEADEHQLIKAPSYLKLVFKDNGIGFENEYAQKIFAIFQRLHGRSEYEGSGIGLAICKKIVEHHRGVIFATGQPGAGATFTIILPA